MKIRTVVAELFDTDGETDMTKSVLACRNFANASTNHDLVWGMSLKDWSRS